MIIAKNEVKPLRATFNTRHFVSPQAYFIPSTLGLPLNVVIRYVVDGKVDDTCTVSDVLWIVYDVYCLASAGKWVPSSDDI